VGIPVGVHPQLANAWLGGQLTGQQIFRGATLLIQTVLTRFDPSGMGGKV
jgi:hypothetical protein